MSNSENLRTDTPQEQPGSEERTGLELAIVGMAGRFPGADDLETFWNNLKQGVETLTFFTDAELLARGADPRQLHGPGYVKAARELSKNEWFDAGFFGISPREAEVIDPQQRVLLESAWHALEDAGYDTERFSGVVGVYAGARMPGYLNNLYSNPALVAEVSDFTVQVANDKDYVALRVSYKLDLGGPSITVQTACSTALVAVHLAGQGLLSGDCDIALAGGVGIRVPEVGFQHTEGQIYSPDGHIRTFDAKARGTMFSSGVGVVVLKRLDDALAAGDAIRAIIRGSAVTNDAAQKVGFTAPGVDGQTRVVRAAMLTAEVHPETMGYVEAHGTGTQMGDPIEVTALSRVYREQTQKKNFCALGSVKTNIGHLGAAAGAASLIKTVLALEHKEIPASLLFDEPNPECHLPESPFYVNTEHRPWEVADGVPRRAGISAFGVGGTNAHVIVEEAPARPPSGPSRPRQLLVLSARSQEALEQMTGSLASYLDAHRELPLADAAYTLAIGRRPFDVRRVVVAENHEDAVRALRALDRDSSATAVVNGKNRPVTFLFSGQGAQYPNMGRGLYESEPVFRAEIDRACELLAPHLGFDLRQVLYPEGATEEAEKKLAETHVTQPALFVIEHALARLWMSWGIEPESMIGHSIGEYVAATVAGVFTLAEALKLVAARGRLMHGLPRGSMVGVPLTEEELAAVLPEGLSIATLNAPNRLVASGPDSGIEELERRLKEKGVAASRLRTSHAFHSPMMEPILAPFLQEFAGIELQAPKVPYVSNVTGTWITAAEATDPAYWARHLRQAVRFSDGLAELLKEPARCLLEVGPGKTLATFARQHPARAKEQPALSSLRHPKDKLNDLAFALRSLGELWAAGVGVDLAKLYRREKRRRVSLPGYAFERQRYWVEPGDLSALAGPKVAKKNEDIADWFYAPYWKPSGPPALPAAWAAGSEPAAGAEPEAEPASWLVFADGRGLADQVVTRLRGLGHRVATVVPGESFAKLGSGAYTLAPGGAREYDALLADLAADGGVPPRALHLWNVTEALPELSPEAMIEAEARSFWSLFFFAQAVGRAGARQPIAIGVVSNNLHRVHGESYLAPEKAALQGPARVIPQEYPNLRVVAIDLALPASGAVEDAALVDRLLAEMAEVPVVAPIVAWRGEDRWVRAYEPVKLAPVGPSGLHFKKKGVYLVTGGLGGIGLTFAEFLARDFQARLVPMGFSALPPRAEWEAWIGKHGERDRISRRLLKLKELEAMGAEVEVVSADVGDEAQVRAAVDQALARFGRIDGVIHAAGVAGRGLLQLKSPETAATVLAPKLRGTLMLERALAGQKLDFFVLCSSTIALAGGLGQVDYCAANSFLDAYAQARSGTNGSGANGTRVISINWGAWGEVGMAVDAGLIPGGAAAAGSPAAGGPPTLVPLHPLLDRSTFETAAEAIYTTDFSTDRHWVAAEHRVLGTATVPGTTYLEIARAAYAHHAAVFEQHGGLGGVELRDVFFLGPLMLADGESKEVRTTLEKQGNGFSFRVASKGPPKTAGAEATWAAHVRGKVGPAPAPAGEAAPRFDIEELLARCADQVVEFNEPVMMGEGGVVRWGPRWQSLKRVHMGAAGKGEALAVLELPEEFAAEAGSFGLHPALVDVATGILGFIEEGNFLPLSYKRLEMRKPLPAKIYSYLRRQGEPGGGKETLSVDVSLLDESGEELVRIDQFTLKRVGEAVDTLRRSAEATGRQPSAPAEGEPAAQPARPAATPAPGATTDAAFDPDAGSGILPHEGVEALRRVLAKDHSFAQLATTSKDLAALFEQVNSLTRASLAGRGDGVQAKRSSHARPSLSTAYMAPRNPMEEKLAEIWKGSLGIEQIGIHDNFFDLGGDSVMGIQLVARANDAGLELSPEQLFEHQTIAELAVLVAPLDALLESSAPAGSAAATAGEDVAGVSLEGAELEEVFSQLGEAR